MDYRDYYATLGVDKGASQADIKKAFRRLARENHPDVNKSAAAEKRFKEISEANEVLSDPEKRKAYDQLGANWQAYQQAGASGAPGGGNPFAGFGGFSGAAGGSAGGFPGGTRFEFRGSAEDLSGFSDFFRTFFGGGGGFRRGRRGRWWPWSRRYPRRPPVRRTRRRYRCWLRPLRLRHRQPPRAASEASPSGRRHGRRHHQPRGGHAWHRATPAGR